MLLWDLAQAYTKLRDALCPYCAKVALHVMGQVGLAFLGSVLGQGF